MLVGEPAAPFRHKGLEVKLDELASIRAGSTLTQFSSERLPALVLLAVQAQRGGQ